MADRLHKYIANCGICSRRNAEVLIQEGRVEVNGVIVSELGTKVEEGDEVRVDGERIGKPKLSYVIMNKPKGVVTTMDDPRKRNTIVRYLPDIGVVLKPVGRLDMDTEGLLICTNDGELAARLTHPRYGIEKEYVATIEGVLDEKQLGKLCSGIGLDGKKTAPAQFTVVYENAKGNETVVNIVLHEGRYRQIRRMFEAVGSRVLALKRVRLGPIRLVKLAAGQCRTLGDAEVKKLQAIAGLSTEAGPRKYNQGDASKKRPRLESAKRR